MIDALNKMLAPLRNRITNMVARAVVQLVDDSTKMQLAQLAVLTDETREGVERFQNYGFTSNPKPGAEAVVLFVGGRRDHGLAVAVDDRRWRIRNLESGEVAVYNHTGAKIVFKTNGDIEATPASGTFKVIGDVHADGVSLKHHTHGAGTPPDGLTSPSGTVTGSTGEPS